MADRIKQTWEIVIPELKRFNHETNEYEVKVPQHRAVVEVEIDVRSLVYVFGIGAARNKSKVSTACAKGIVVRYLRKVDE